MDERDELERSLRSFDAGPGPVVRDEVLRAFDETRARRAAVRPPRPATVLRVLAATIGLLVVFLAGRWSISAPPSTREAGERNRAELAIGLSWQPATADLLRADRTSTPFPTVRPRSPGRLNAREPR